MECEAAEKAVEAVGAAKSKVVIEAVAGYVHHGVLVWERWDGALWIFV